MASSLASKIQVVACYHYDFLFLVFLFKKWDRMVFLKKINNFKNQIKFFKKKYVLVFGFLPWNHATTCQHPHTSTTTIQQLQLLCTITTILLFKWLNS